MVERYNKEIIQAAKTATKCENASVTQRMVKVIKALNIKQYHEENDAVYQNLHHVENSLLHQRVQGTIIASVTPILAKLVEEGVREGILADYMFTPLLFRRRLSCRGSVGKLIGVGSGRGTGFLIMVAGRLLTLVSMGLYQIKSVQQLEQHE